MSAEHAVLHLMATAANPDDPGAASALVGAIMGEAERIANQQEGDLSRLAQSVINEALSAPGGVIAGEMLLHMISFAEHSPKHRVGVNKACRILSRMALDGWRCRDDTEMPTSHSRVMEQWGRYSCVAHVWAAWLLAIEDADAEELFTEDGMRKLFGMVRAVFDLAQAHGLPGCNPSILPPTHLADHVTLTVPTPTEWELSVIGEYRAPTAQK